MMVVMFVMILVIGPVSSIFIEVRGRLGWRWSSQQPSQSWPNQRWRSEGKNYNVMIKMVGKRLVKDGQIGDG